VGCGRGIPHWRWGLGRGLCPSPENFWSFYLEMFGAFWDFFEVYILIFACHLCACCGLTPMPRDVHVNHRLQEADRDMGWAAWRTERLFSANFLSNILKSIPRRWQEQFDDRRGSTNCCGFELTDGFVRIAVLCTTETVKKRCLAHVAMHRIAATRIMLPPASDAQNREIPR